MPWVKDLALLLLPLGSLLCMEALELPHTAGVAKKQANKKPYYFLKLLNYLTFFIFIFKFLSF